MYYIVRGSCGIRRKEPPPIFDDLFRSKGPPFRAIHLQDPSPFVPAMDMGMLRQIQISASTTGSLASY